MSGYTDEAIVRRGVLERGGAFIEKPFSSDEFARHVRRVLDGRSAAKAGAASSKSGRPCTRSG
jgi:FixJ family two-component response regulator